MDIVLLVVNQYIYLDCRMNTRHVIHEFNNQRRPIYQRSLRD